MIRIGIVSGKEAFTRTLIAELNSRAPDVRAEYCRIFETRLGEPTGYHVIIDRLSHVFEYYRPYLKHAAATGTYVMSNPFRFLSDDKFFNYALARQLGVSVPRTVVLPCKEYDERVLDSDDLHNLGFPLDWKAIADYVGFPAVLKPYDGYGWREVYTVHSLKELMEIYDDSMMDVMMLQQFIQWDHYVRAFVVGQKHVLPSRYDPVERRYIVDHAHLSPDLGRRIVSDCTKLCSALGYDVNTVEFAIKDDVAYAIDFMNPVPDAKPETITPLYFTWLVKTVADVALEYARTGKRTGYHLAPPPEPALPAFRMPSYLPE
ncbi:MAG: hypothetical protein AB1758_17105 [Candidatus Eremiobacterota bacterium]